VVSFYQPVFSIIFVGPDTCFYQVTVIVIIVRGRDNSFLAQQGFTDGVILVEAVGGIITVVDAATSDLIGFIIAECIAQVIDRGGKDASINYILLSN